MTPREVKAARQALNRGEDYRAVAKRLGFDPRAIRRLVDRKFDTKLKTEARKRAKGRSKEKLPGALMRIEISHRPGVDQVADAAARCVAPRSLGAIAFGDPPPGWSALDRRSAGQ